MAVVYVVDDKVMTHEAIIGLNILKKDEVKIHYNGIIGKNKSSKIKQINLIIAHAAKSSVSIPLPTPNPNSLVISLGEQDYKEASNRMFRVQICKIKLI